MFFNLMCEMHDNFCYHEYQKNSNIIRLLGFPFLAFFLEKASLLTKIQ